VVQALCVAGTEHAMAAGSGAMAVVAGTAVLGTVASHCARDPLARSCVHKVNAEDMYPDRASAPPKNKKFA